VVFFWDCTDENLDSVPDNVVISQMKRVRHEVLQIVTMFDMTVCMVYPKSRLQFN